MRGWRWETMNLIPKKDGDMPDEDKPYQTRFENFIHSHTPKQATDKHHTTKAHHFDLEKFENPHFSVSKLAKT